MHGYQLNRELSEQVGGMWRVSYGSLYPSLRRLERDGAITSEPGTGARRKTVYAITEEGERLFLELLQEPPAGRTDRGRTVPRAPGVLPVPAARDADPAARAPAPGVSRHGWPTSRRTSATPQTADDYQRALLEHARAGAESDIAWLTELIRTRTAEVRDHRPRGGAASRERDAAQEGAHTMTEVRIAIVGLGNCASSLVQGLEYYKDADPNESVPGLMHVELGGYHIRDVRIVAAFDVDAKKVGTDVAEAIFTEPNNTIRFSDVPPTGVTVQRGHTFDGLGTYYRDMITESELEPVDVAQVLRDTRADVLISYLPVGSEHADKHYAQCAIDAGVAFVNALPVFIASDPVWAKKFADAGRADRRRRHQVAGRRHDHAPRPRQALRGPRRRARPHLPAELRRQHGLHEHARARAPDVEEDLQDAVGAVPARPAPAQGIDPHRPERPRAVARGPQVGDDPPRGSQLRRRAPDDRDEARGLGLPELGGRDHRRPAVREAREGSRDRRPDHRPERLLHEEPAGAVHRRRGATDGRGVRERGDPARGRRPRSARQTSKA